MKKSLIRSILIVIVALGATTWAGPTTVRAATGPICYVNADAYGAGNGNSWFNAYTSLQTALVDPNCTEIWVAAHVYTPGAYQSSVFNIPAGRALYGGFEGNETLRTQREPAVHITILSGDIDDNDVNTDGNHIDENASDIVGSNTHRVVAMLSTSTPITPATVLDGFVITGGDAAGYFDGGGLYCAGSGAGHGCSPTLSYLVFSGNRAYNGGALYIDGGADGYASPALTAVTFSGNAATYSGGAVYVNGSGGTSNPTFVGAIFKDNQAGASGGAVLNTGDTGGVSNPTFGIVMFDHNTAAYHGGAVFSNGSAGTSNPTYNMVSFTNNSAGLRGGAVDNNATSSGESVAVFTNVTFHGNSADLGGAIYNDGYGGLSSPLLTNVTFSGNTATTRGTMYNDGLSGGSSTPALINVILWGDSAPAHPEVYNSTANPTYTYSIVQGSGGSASWNTVFGTDLGGNLDTDPLLEPILNNWIMPLASGSPAIDHGSPSTCPPYDQRGITRPQGAGCDIGAYEYDLYNVDVQVGASLVGSHIVHGAHGQEHNYAGTNSGPAQVTNTDAGKVVSSIRVLYGGSSYSEMMGFPNKSTTDFWFPWYNNTAMDSQFRVSNLGTSSTTITVTLANTPIDSFSLGAGAAIRKNYPGQNSGPMHVSSSGATPILATIRVLYGGTSFTEMMGYPNSTTSQFWFPWYNNTAMDSQFRVSNLGAAPTTITVTLAGTPIDSFSLGAGAAIRKNYAGQNNGPMHVSSSGGVPILATVRVLWGSSFSEMMGYPNNNTTGEFWFPWYDNVGTDAQLRVSNLGGSATTIKVYLAEGQIDSFSLGAGAALRKNYAGLNDGGLHVTSSGGMPILATVRLLYAGTSFYELMGFPGNALTGTQYFPWYNNIAMDSQMRMAVP